MTKKIYYERNYAIGKFLFEKIGIEQIIEKGETEDDAILRARLMVEKNHIENNPQLYTGGVKSVPVEDEDIPVIQVKQERVKAKPDAKIMQEYLKAVEQKDEIKIEQLTYVYDIKTI